MKTSAEEFRHLCNVKDLILIKYIGSEESKPVSAPILLLRYVQWVVLSLLAGGQVLAAPQHSHHGDICAAYSALDGGTWVESIQDGDWNDPRTWGGEVPDHNSRVTILHQVSATEGEASMIQIRGDLHLAGALHAYGSVMVCLDGRLQSQVGTLAFHVENDRTFAGNTRPGPVSQYPDFHPADTGLWVMPGGELDLVGEEVTSWVNAAALSDSRPRSLQKGVRRSIAFEAEEANLSSQPAGWQAGDQLLLVNERGESGLARLDQIDGTRISYNFNPGVEPIEGYVLHVDADTESRTINPKIANLSRRMRIIGADVVETDVNHRAHVAFMQGSRINVRGVEFRNLGPRGKLGRYPVHWHHNGDTDGSLVSSSIWQSVDDGGNRFVTMHMVSGALIENNVGYRSQGHGFFMEEVRETNNVLRGNLSVDVRHGEELPNVDEGLSDKTHHYWVRSGNVFEHNVAAGNRWDGRGKGNHMPDIEGLVVLPSNANDKVTVVSGFECLGCGGIGMWTAVPDTVFEGPVSSYAVVAAFRGYDTWNFDASRTILQDPLFLLNGDNELFDQTRDGQDSVPWASQIYLNYGAVSVRGGTLVGETGIHSHYNSRFSLDNTRIIANTSIDPTYWETAAVITNSVIDADVLFKRGYGSKRRASPGLIQFHDTCFRSRCNDSGLDTLGYSSSYYARLFPGSGQTNSHSARIDIDEGLLRSGFIKPPEGVDARYWSITPVDSPSDGSGISPIREREAVWRQHLSDVGGFPDGFPPGEYRVDLYSEDDEGSLLGSETVMVRPGEVVELR